MVQIVEWHKIDQSNEKGAIIYDRFVYCHTKKKYAEIVNIYGHNEDNC